MSYASMFADQHVMDLKTARALLGVDDKATKADVHSSWRATLQKAYELAHEKARDVAAQASPSTSYNATSDSWCSWQRSRSSSDEVPTFSRRSTSNSTTSTFGSLFGVQPPAETPLHWEDQFDGFAFTCAFTEPDWGFEVNYDAPQWTVSKIIPFIGGRTTQAISKGVAVGLCITHVCEVPVTETNAAQLKNKLQGGGYVKVTFAPPASVVPHATTSTALVPFDPQSQTQALVLHAGVDAPNALLEWCRTRNWWWKKDAQASAPRAVRAYDQVESWFKSKEDFAVTWLPRQAAEPRGRRFRFRTQGRFTSSY